MQPLSEKYAFYLNAIRINPLLLENLTAERDGHVTITDRLRISIALFNDLRMDDYGLVKFLYTEELKAKKKHGRKHGLTGLELLGFMLAKFKNPEDAWLLYEGYGMDKAMRIESVLAVGTAILSVYLKGRKHKNTNWLLRLVDPPKGNLLKYSQKDIEDWTEHQEERFSIFKFPLENEIDFAEFMQEKERIAELLPQWVSRQTTWTPENLLRYLFYAQEYSNDVETEIQALEIFNSHTGNRAGHATHQRLADIYVSRNDQENALRVIRCMLSNKPSTDVRAACIRHLCTIILKNGDPGNPNSQQANTLIGENKRRLKGVPLNVKKLVDKAVRTMA